MREVSIYGLIAAKKTRKINLIVVVSSALNLILNLWFIPIWNALGAAFATLLAQLFYLLLMHRSAQKAYYIPYDNRKIIILLFTGIVLSITGLLMNDLMLGPRVILKTIILISFPFILHIFNFYEPVELQAIKGFARKWTRIRDFRKNLQSLKGITDNF